MNDAHAQNAARAVFLAQDLIETITSTSSLFPRQQQATLPVALVVARQARA